VELAAGVQLRPHAYVTGRTQIGERTQIFPFAVVGEEPQDKNFQDETASLIIGANNVIREHSSIHVGTVKGGGCTRVGDDNLIMTSVHIGHDAQIGNHVILAGNSAVAGHVEVQDYAVLGGISGVHQFARIGESAMVASLSGVSLDAPPFSIVAGDRTTIRGINTIGLKRRGIGAEARREIKRVYHLVLNSKLRLEDALARAKDEGFTSPEAGRLITFLETSERGFSR
jgi:UDP-N-acetylglucosamine acyltransferase